MVNSNHISWGNEWETWLLKALLKYRKAIREDTLEDIQAVSCILVGKAQEGKTRLTLSLLGFRNKELDQIEKILRLDNRIGQSSTKKVMIYRLVDGEFSEKSLKELENSVRASLKEKEVKISLPKSVNNFRDLGIKEIVDFVGLDPRDKKEGERAFKILEKYFHSSDLVIYVARANHIANLSEYERYPGILDYWKKNPEGCVIVITYAYEQGDDNSGLKKIIKEVSSPERVFFLAKGYYENLIKKQTGYNGPLPLVLPVSLKYSAYGIGEKEVEATEIALDKLADKLRRSKAKVINRVCWGFYYPITKKRRIEDLTRENKEIINKVNYLNKKIEKEKKRLKNFKRELDKLERIPIDKIRRRVDSLKFDGMYNNSSIVTEILHRTVNDFFEQKESLSLSSLNIKFPYKKFIKIIFNQLLDFLCDKNGECKESLKEEMLHYGVIDKVNELIYSFWKRFKNAFYEVCIDEKNQEQFDKKFIVKERKLLVFKKIDKEGTYRKLIENRQEFELFVKQLMLKALSEASIERKWHLKKFKGKIKEFLNKIEECKETRSRSILIRERDIKKLEGEKNELLQKKSANEQRLNELEDLHSQALKFTEYVIGEFIDYWNQKISLVNSSNDIMVRIENLMYLERASKILESFMETCRRVKERISKEDNHESK